MNNKSGRQSPPNRRLSTKSGGLNGLRSAGGVGGLTSGPMNSSIISDTTEDPGILKQKVVMLERDLERRQESYISRERSYKTRIDELEEELTRQRTRKTGWMKTDAKFTKLKTMQGQIVNNVELVQDRTARILQEQERDLLRAFRARLFDVQTELEKEKSKKDDGAGAWIERSRQLEAEVEWAKEVADRLERANQSLSSENTRLKAQFKTQEDDRNYLIKQLVAVKKDNARLRAEYGAVEQENTQLQDQVQDRLPHHSLNSHLSLLLLSTPALSLSHTQIKILDENRQTTILPRVNQARGDQEERYKEANTRLRKLLADERKSLQQVRQNYANELRSRTELEMLLRSCVEDVRKEIARRSPFVVCSLNLTSLSSLSLFGRQIESAQLGSILKGISSPGDINKVYSLQPASHIPIDSFAQEDRERALELLLSQERVVTLLYSKVFPVTNNAANAPNSLNGNAHRGVAGVGGTGGGKSGLMGPSIDELLHGTEDDDDSTVGNPTARPSTTGGLGGGNGSTSSLRPHTLGGGEDLTGDGK
jgi:hypothetical protein